MQLLYHWFKTYCNQQAEDSGGWESCCNKSVTPVHKQSWIEKLLEEGTQAEANKILNGETVHDCVATTSQN